jgi:hypothetical protein
MVCFCLTPLSQTYHIRLSSITVDMIAAQAFSQYILEKFRSINDVVFVNLYRQEPQGVLDSPVYSGLLLTSKKVLQK